MGIARILTWGTPGGRDSARPDAATSSSPTGRVNWGVELAVTAVVTLVTIGGTAMAAHNNDEGHVYGVAPIALLVGAISAVPLRRLYPSLALAIALGFTAAYMAMDYPKGPLFFPLLITFVNAVLSGYRRNAIASLVVGFVAIPWLPAVTGRGERPSLAVVVALFSWLCALLGVAEAIRYRREQLRASELTQKEALARQVTEERLRIARDLHDVVAHSMSLINIQAGVALHLIEQHPDQARSSLSTIKQASKDALVELRSILGVLRQVDEEGIGPSGEGGEGSAAPRAPVPGLDLLDDLVERARAAAVHVQVEAQPGAIADLPRPVDLAAFRIVQESLTNVARHSHARAPIVRLGRKDGGLLVEVLDEGVARAPSEALPGAGHGITGMRERAASVGGWLEAGPRPGRGFLVRAWLPITEPGLVIEPAPEGRSLQRPSGARTGEDAVPEDVAP